MSVSRCIIGMNVNNTLINLAKFSSNLPQSKHEAGFFITYAFRKLANKCMRVFVENRALHKPVQYANLSAAKKHSTNVISKEMPWW